jgi:hypothetical protein
VGRGNDFLNRTPIAQEIRARIDKWDCTKLKSSAQQSEETAYRMGKKKSLLAIELTED